MASPSLRRAGELGKRAGSFSRLPGAVAGRSADCCGGFQGATLPADQRMPCATDPLRSPHLFAGPSLRSPGRPDGLSLMTLLSCPHSRCPRLGQNHLGGVELWSTPGQRLLRRAREQPCLPTRLWWDPHSGGRLLRCGVLGELARPCPRKGSIQQAFAFGYRSPY